MPTQTYQPLATVTLGSSASSVTFSSIPATYRDLILVSVAGCTLTTETARLRFNADTGNNYNWVFMNGVGSGSPVSSAQSNQNNMDFSPYVGISGTVGKWNNILQIQDYSATDKHKTVLTRTNINGDTYPGTTAMAGRWASTSAITSILVYPSSGSFIAGSTFSLYGVIA
jgi:hypothetical protein